MPDHRLDPELKPPGLRIGELDGAMLADWDRFVSSAPGATFFHRAGWKAVIERSFGHRTYFLYAAGANGIEGVLPLVHIKSRLFGNSLISLGFCVYGGPLAATAAALDLLDRRARALAEELGVSHLEYRTVDAPPFPGAVERSDLYVTFRKPIDPDVDKNMLAIPRKQRAMVRKGQKLGLRSDIDDDCRRLHPVYGESVRNLGTPVFSRRYFDELQRAFGADCEILVVTKDGQAVSAVMSFYFRDQVLPYYGGGTAAARELAGNDFMYWEVMRRACERGFRLFDFGRSKRGTGAFDFKKNWGFPAEPLRYQYILRHGEKPPDLNPLNPKFRLFIAAWKRLPLPVAGLLGPHIVKFLG
jgi:FemAB-related protein (PEP-CTERM system-associated)